MTLDVVNRLYYYVRDAEGVGFQNQFGTLAKLREPSHLLSKNRKGKIGNLRN